MKRSKVVIMILAMVSMTGCLVSSLHPFFKPEDKIYAPAMEGHWIDGDSSIWTISPDFYIESATGKKITDSTYNVIYYEDDHSKAELMGTLFQLNGVDYVDFVPDPDEEHTRSEMTSWHHVPVHTLARVQYNKDSILIYWYGDEWLNELFEQNRIRIKHETVDAFDYDRHVLTAGTEELQKFIKKYANDPKTVEEIQAIFAEGDTDGGGDYGLFLKLKPYNGPLPGREAEQVQPG